MNLIALEDGKPETPNMGPKLFVASLVILTKPPRCKQSLQEFVQVLVLIDVCVIRGGIGDSYRILVRILGNGAARREYTLFTAKEAIRNAHGVCLN